MYKNSIQGMKDVQFKMMLTGAEKKELQALSKALSTTQSNVMRLGVRYLKQSLSQKKVTNG